METLSRRAALALSGVAAMLAARPVRAAIATPEQTSGPYYPAPDQRPADTDWDLVKVEGALREAGGEVLWLSGQVLDRAGAPVAGARVEIWQCDVNGRYHHPRDQGEGRPLDTGFQGFGAMMTGEEGGYRFRTIRPVAYPGRTPHIHARVVTSGRDLVTQIYLSDEPANQRDFIYRRLGAAGQAAVTIDPVQRADGDLEAGFDFVV